MEKDGHILFVSIATNRYWDFIGPLHASIRSHWSETGVPVRFLVLTNRRDARASDGSTTIRSVTHRPWPGMTLYRSHIFLANRDVIGRARWVVYLDADLRVVGDLGRHFLCRSFATLHPGYAVPRPGLALPFERRGASAACIRDPEPGTYVCGGVQGGEADWFLRMSETIAGRIDADAAAGITACWHDESHFNRFCQDDPPARLLTPAFAYPQQAVQAEAWGLLGMVPVILALDKDHNAYRYGIIRRSALWFRARLGGLFRRCLPRRARRP
jgi:histo-blood group ABO system transferase